MHKRDRHSVGVHKVDDIKSSLPLIIILRSISYSSMRDCGGVGSLSLPYSKKYLVVYVKNCHPCGLAFSFCEVFQIIIRYACCITSYRLISLVAPTLDAFFADLRSLLYFLAKTTESIMLSR